MHYNKICELKNDYSYDHNVVIAARSKKFTIGSTNDSAEMGILSKQEHFCPVVALSPIMMLGNYLVHGFMRDILLTSASEQCVIMVVRFTGFFYPNIDCRCSSPILKSLISTVLISSGFHTIQKTIAVLDVSVRTHKSQ